MAKYNSASAATVSPAQHRLLLAVNAAKICSYDFT